MNKSWQRLTAFFNSCSGNIISWNTCFVNVSSLIALVVVNFRNFVSGGFNHPNKYLNNQWLPNGNKTSKTQNIDLLCLNNYWLYGINSTCYMLFLRKFSVYL